MQNLFLQTAAGTLQVSITDESISNAIFIDTTDRKSSSTLPTHTLLLSGTPFQQLVWQAALAIPAGQTRTYQDIAVNIGKPKAHRAVANALGANKIAYLIPCHRVIRTDGSLGGYKWGLEKKKMLLHAEGALPKK